MLTLTLLTALAPLTATQADVPVTVSADAATPEADAAPVTAPKRSRRSFVCALPPLPRKAPVAGPDAADPAAAPTSSSVTTTPSTATVTPAIDEVATEAAGPSWSYVQVAAGTTTFEVLGTDIDLDTVDVKAGAQVSDTVYLHATYQESDFTLGGKATGLKIGAGLRAPLSPTVDLFAQGSYVSAEAEAINAETDGWGVDAGIRAMVAPRLELGASVQYVDDGTLDSTTYEGHAYFNVVGGLALAAELLTDPDADQSTTLFGLRYSF